MISISRRWLLPATLLATFVPAQAAPLPAQPSRPDPLDALAAVPPLVYHSPLASYRRQADDKPMPWREANDNVGRIGGWRSYAREAQQAASAAEPAVSTPPPAPGKAVP